MVDARQIGAALRAIRVRRQVPLIVAAERSGLSISELNQYERGSAQLPSTTLLSLLEALESSLDDLQVEIEGGVASPARAARNAGQWLLRYAEAIRKAGA